METTTQYFGDLFSEHSASIKISKYIYRGMLLRVSLRCPGAGKAFEV
jgi:hypothetical protein